MSDTIIVGALSLVGTLVGSLGGMRLMTYRIEQLERRVNEHNNLIERTYKLEQQEAIHDEQIKVANHRIEDLEKRCD